MSFINGLAVGRIVHFVMPNGEHRPGIVVRILDRETGTSNLYVFPDGTNDGPQFGSTSRIAWETSRKYSEALEPYSWHFPEREV